MLIFVDFMHPIGFNQFILKTVDIFLAMGIDFDEFMICFPLNYSVAKGKVRLMIINLFFIRITEV